MEKFFFLLCEFNGVTYTETQVHDKNFGDVVVIESDGFYDSVELSKNIIRGSADALMKLALYLYRYFRLFPVGFRFKKVANGNFGDENCDNWLGGILVYTDPLPHGVVVYGDYSLSDSGERRSYLILKEKWTRRPKVIDLTNTDLKSIGVRISLYSMFKNDVYGLKKFYSELFSLDSNSSKKRTSDLRKNVSAPEKYEVDDEAVWHSIEDKFFSLCKSNGIEYSERLLRKRVGVDVFIVESFGLSEARYLSRKIVCGSAKGLMKLALYFHENFGLVPSGFSFKKSIINGLGGKKIMLWKCGVLTYNKFFPEHIKVFGDCLMSDCGGCYSYLAIKDDSKNELKIFDAKGVNVNKAFIDYAKDH